MCHTTNFQQCQHWARSASRALHVHQGILIRNKTTRAPWSFSGLSAAIVSALTRHQSCISAYAFDSCVFIRGVIFLWYLIYCRTLPIGLRFPGYVIRRQAQYATVLPECVCVWIHAAPSFSWTLLSPSLPGSHVPSYSKTDVMFWSASTSPNKNRAVQRESGFCGTRMCSRDFSGASLCLSFTLNYLSQLCK